ncbi:MAG: phenylalanine--tRNA ligase subunit alpha [Candidatus Micrarchaeia archaeon]|jgi:phenylalanyl-tRNA synthetase alpha chain
MILQNYERQILKSLELVNTLDQISSVTNLNRDKITRALYWLAENNLIEIKEESTIEIKLTEEAENYLKNGFPELNVIQKAINKKRMDELTNEEKRIGLAWGIKNNWIIIKDGVITPTSEGLEALNKKSIVKTCEYILENKKLDEFSKNHLLKRNLIIEKTNKEISAILTEKGKKAIKDLPKEQEEIKNLTQQNILSGEWKKKYILPYDVTIDSEEIYPGKRHILALFMEKIKGIFIEMGFEEMEGDIIQSSFWNFDALFQPQDHPARELADTFYLEENIVPLPEDKELIKKIKQEHEKGWKYMWDIKKAEKSVLRTHTTSISSKYLYTKGTDTKPKAFFCIGRNYRNETIDYKHLAEFYQVEGIVISENATFTQLLGLLKEFYKKLGFEKIRFVPGYFPYTEPSVEVEAYFEDRKEWIELGGAGIFRPEVSLPLCNKYPVLAWGLSLERPLMLMYNISDIRTFYKNNVLWLRQTKKIF